MSISHRLRGQDVAGVFRLVHECRECWADAAGWQGHLLDGMCRLTGLAVGLYVEQCWSGEGNHIRFLDFCDRGWRDDVARSRFMRLFDDHPDLAGFLPGCTRVASAARGSGASSVLRPQLAPDRLWYASRVFNDYHRPARIDGYVLSFAARGRDGRRAGAAGSEGGGVSGGSGVTELAGEAETQVVLCACQGEGDAAPTHRARAVVSLLNQQVAPLVGQALATRRQRGRHGLTPRLKQALDALLTGAAEKQIAALLGIRPATAHEYIGRLYAHFGVAGRAELMAYFIARAPSTAAVAIPDARRGAPRQSMVPRRRSSADR